MKMVLRDQRVGDEQIREMQTLGIASWFEQIGFDRCAIERFGAYHRGINFVALCGSLWDGFHPLTWVLLSA